MRSSRLCRTAENPATLAANQKCCFVIRAERHTSDTHLLVGTDLGTKLAWKALGQQSKSVTDVTNTDCSNSVPERVTYKLCIMVHSCSSTWSTSAYQSPTSLLGSISGPPVNDSSSFLVLGHRPHPFHRTAFMDTGLLNGFLFSFSINLLVWFVQ